MMTKTKTTRFWALLLAMVMLLASFPSTSILAASNGVTEVTLGRVKANGLNLRSQKSTSSKVLTVIPKDTKIILGEDDGEWTQVMIAGYVGYVVSKYVVTLKDGDANLSYGRVLGEVVYMREGPSTKTEKVASFSEGKYLKIIGIKDGWFKVSSLGGKYQGYMCPSYLLPVKAEEVEEEQTAQSTSTEKTSAKSQSEDTKSSEESTKTDTSKSKTKSSESTVTASKTTKTESKSTTTSTKTTKTTTSTKTTATESKSSSKKTSSGTSTTKSTEEKVTVSSEIKATTVNANASETETAKESSASTKSSKLADQVIATAKKYIGIKYKWGGASPSTGFDCGGFVYYVFNKCGIDLPRTGQYNEGTKVSYKNLRKGDLVFFSNSSKKIGHVGIYIGDGKFIHSPRTGKTVEITSLTSGYYYNHFVTARRVID